MIRSSQMASPSAVTGPVPVAGKRIPELDGFRGVAIILVVAFHFVYTQLKHPAGAFERIAQRITSFGWVGVDLFFTLSGFLIGGILIRTKGSPNYFKTFYFRRLVRIIPNYYLLMLVFLIILSIPFFSQDYFLAKNNVIPFWAYLTFVQNFFIARLENFGTLSMSVTWSICVEEQFYLLFPLAVYFLPRHRLPYFLLLAIVAAPFFRAQYTGWIPAYVLLPCRMDAIAFGALVACLNESGRLNAFLKKWSPVLWALLVADLLTCGFLFLRYGDLGVERNSLFSLFFTLCLLFGLGYRHSFYAAVLRMGWLRFIGTISYSLYLFHFLILGLTKNLIGNFSSIPVAGTFQIAVSLFALGLSVLIAWVIYRKFEAPFVAIGKRMKY